jgi:protein SCO1/2
MKTSTPRHSLAALFLLVLAALTNTAIAQSSQAAASEPVNAANAAVNAHEFPRYLLQNGRGRAVMVDDFRNRFQLISFGFTGCPDVCPTSMLEMQQVMAALGDRAKQVQPIFITVDPERDTGAVLDAYTANFDSRILGLTGSLQLVRWAANNFKVQFEKVREPGAAPHIYTMDHTAGMFLLGPDGQRITKFMYATPVKDMVATINQWLDVNEKLPKK